MYLYNKCGIYCIENTINGKVYIGSSRNIGQRKAVHYSDLKHNKHHSKVLQRAYDKYGKDAFKFSVLEFCKEEDRIEIEQKWLDVFFTNSYNILESAEKPQATLGRVWTEEEKLKQSQLIKSKGFKHSPETVEKMRLRMSDPNQNPMSNSEYRKKISDKGRLFSPEICEEIYKKKYEDGITYRQLVKDYNCSLTGIYNSIQYHKQK